MNFKKFLFSISPPFSLADIETTPNKSIHLFPQEDTRNNIPETRKKNKKSFLFLHHPLTEKDILELEFSLAKKIPESYRTFLSYFNGGSLFFGSLNLYGKVTRNGRNDYTNSSPIGLVEENARRSIYLLDEYLKIGSYPDGGVMVTINARGECVLIANHQGYLSAPLKTWPSFDSMFVEECTRLCAFFDAKGKFKDLDAKIGPPVDLSSVVIDLPADIDPPGWFKPKKQAP